MGIRDLIKFRIKNKQIETYPILECTTVCTGRKYRRPNPLEIIYSSAAEDIGVLTDEALKNIVEKGIGDNKDLEKMVNARTNVIINDRAICRFLNINYGSPTKRNYLEAIYVAFLSATKGLKPYRVVKDDNLLPATGGTAGSSVVYDIDCLSANNKLLEDKRD